MGSNETSEENAVYASVCASVCHRSATARAFEVSLPASSVRINVAGAPWVSSSAVYPIICRCAAAPTTGRGSERRDERRSDPVRIAVDDLRDQALTGRVPRFRVFRFRGKLARAPALPFADLRLNELGECVALLRHRSTSPSRRSIPHRPCDREVKIAGHRVQPFSWCGSLSTIAGSHGAPTATRTEN
jgi:hypothetical protein